MVLRRVAVQSQRTRYINMSRIQNRTRTWKQGIKRLVEPPKTQIKCKNPPNVQLIPFGVTFSNALSKLKAQSSKLKGLFSLKRSKRDVRALSFELSKMSPHVGLAVYRVLRTDSPFACNHRAYDASLLRHNLPKMYIEQKSVINQDVSWCALLCVKVWRDVLCSFMFM